MAVEQSELNEVVEKLIGSPDPGPWSSHQLHEAAASATVGIWRVRGNGWSVILKLIGLGKRGHPNWQAGEGATHWYYWRREVLAYESGLLSSFPDGMRAPACYLIADRPDGTVALWLEDVESAGPGISWPIERYRLASLHLGRAQGEFAAGRPLPGEAWLSRGWMRAYLSQRDSDYPLLEEPAAWKMPLTRGLLSVEWARPVLEMRRDQTELLSTLERFPETVCHLDLHPGNLFGRDLETVVIDWSFVGIGSIGEDAGNLVPDSVLDFHVRPERIDDLYDAVLDGYLTGLQDAGWTGSADTVDLAMRATIAAKYAWIAPAMLRAVLDESELLNNRPIEESFDWWAPVIPFILKCAKEARRLKDLLS